jgi:hypothetical protein
MEFDNDKCCVFQFPMENNCFSVGFESFIFDRSSPPTVSAQDILKINWPMVKIASAKMMANITQNAQWKVVGATILALGSKYLQPCRY